MSKLIKPTPEMCELIAAAIDYGKILEEAKKPGNGMIYLSEEFAKLELDLKTAAYEMRFTGPPEIYVTEDVNQWDEATDHENEIENENETETEAETNPKDDKEFNVVSFIDRALEGFTFDNKLESQLLRQELLNSGGEISIEKWNLTNTFMGSRENIPNNIIDVVKTLDKLIAGHAITAVSIVTAATRLIGLLNEIQNDDPDLFDISELETTISLAQFVRERIALSLAVMTNQVMLKSKFVEVPIPDVDPSQFN